MRKKYPVSLLCRLLDVSRSGYYKWRRRRGIKNRYEKDRELLTELLYSHHLRHPSYGYHRLSVSVFRETGWIFSHNLAHKCCKQAGIHSKARKHGKYRKPGEGGKGIEIDLDKGIDAVRAELTKYPVSTRVSLNGTIIVARDIAHAKLKARLDAGEDLPQYFKDHPILYAGPAKTPEGYPCGSMGPTTANRMDPYVDEFQDHGGSLVMIAKGNRTQVVTDACKKHGGFYLGTIGGIAAVLSKECITSIECVEYPELGMEAIWKITVKDFPAFILVDDKGHDFFKELKPWTPCNTCGK